MVRFFNEDISFDHTALANVTPWLHDVATAEHCQLASLVYIFCSDSYLLSVNQQFLRHDFYTDVITFDHREDGQNAIEGDIFISIDRVTENAASLSEPFFSELIRVMVHGLLHLVGHDDTSHELKQSMRRLEDKYLHLYATSHPQP